MPWAILFFQSFNCGSNSINIAGEIIYPPFTQCMGISQIVYFSVFIFCALCFSFLLWYTSFFFSLTILKSPVPWADQNFFGRILTLTQKLVIAAFLVFDPQVNLFDNLLNISWRIN